MMATNNNKPKWEEEEEWTNEKHLHFLNSMEASFVQSMFNKIQQPPLDRYLPDIFESTNDLGKEKRPTTTHDFASESSERTEKKKRILSCQKSSEDQVVPRFEKKR